MSDRFSRQSGPQMAHASGSGGNLFAPVSGLAALAAELAELPLGPSPTFRERLRSDLVEEAARRAGARAGLGASTSTSESGEPARRSGSGGGRLGRRLAAAGVAAALTAGGMSAAAAGHAIPGDALYPMKRFGESVRASLDPGSGSGLALRRLSTRIGEVESIAALDPTGAQPERWTGADAALRDADAALTSAIALETPAGLRPGLASSRARLERLLVTVPEAHRPSVQSLLDVIDGVPGVFAAGADVPALPYGLLPPVRLDLGRALADGWPLDPALVLPPPPATSVGPSVASAPTGSSGSTARGAAGGTSSGRGGSLSTSTPSTSSLPRTAAHSAVPSGGGTTSGSTSTGARSGSPRTGVGNVVGRTTTSAVPRTAGSAVSGATDATVGAVGDATDAVNQLPRILSPTVSGATVSGTTKRLTSALPRTP